MKKPVLPKFSQECVLCNCNEINDRMDNACFSEDSISDDLYQHVNLKMYPSIQK